MVAQDCGEVVEAIVEEGVRGRTFLPRHTGQLDRPGTVVQVGHRCLAVKVERPQRSEDERP